MSGSCEKAELEYIIRDHDINKLHEKEEMMISYEYDDCLLNK